MVLLNLCLPQQDLHFCVASMQISTFLCLLFSQYFFFIFFFFLFFSPRKVFLWKINIMILIELLWLLVKSSLAIWAFCHFLVFLQRTSSSLSWQNLQEDSLLYLNYYHYLWSPEKLLRVNINFSEWHLREGGNLDSMECSRQDRHVLYVTHHRYS